MPSSPTGVKPAAHHLSLSSDGIALAAVISDLHVLHAVPGSLALRCLHLRPIIPVYLHSNHQFRSEPLCVIHWETCGSN